MTLSDLKNYHEGEGCKCCASSSWDCGCENSDWTPKIEKLVKCWINMSPSEMRLHCGEMTSREIRTVKAVLKNIIEMAKNG